jgi:hypothetical protein
MGFLTQRYFLSNKYSINMKKVKKIEKKLKMGRYFLKSMV